MVKTHLRDRRLPEASDPVVYLSCGHRHVPYYESAPAVGDPAWCSIDTHVTVISRDRWDALPDPMKATSPSAAAASCCPAGEAIRARLDSGTGDPR